MSPTPSAPSPRDPFPGALPPAPPQHPGPGEGWRPLSGLCLSAFILALALSLLSLVSLWAGLLLPLVLGLVALATVDGTRYRGRALAWWAVGLALVFGAWGLASTRLVNERVGHLTNGFLGALRAERPAEERRTQLEAWLEQGPARAATLERIEARWRLALERLGPVSGPVLLPSIWSGQLPLMVPPNGVVAVDEPDNPSTLPAPGNVLWARVAFQRGQAHMALWVGDGSPTGLTSALDRLGEAGHAPVPVVRDARFFAPAGVVAPAPSAPTER